MDSADGIHAMFSGADRPVDGSTTALAAPALALPSVRASTACNPTEDVMTCTTLKLATAAALTLILGAANTNAQPVTKSKSNGAFAEIIGNDGIGCRFFYIYIARGGTTAAPETYLFYDMYDACTNTSAYGYGTVPNGSLVTSKNTTTIKASGAPSSSFYAEGERANISLTLTRDGVFTQRSSGHVRYEYYDHAVQRHGTWTYYSANVSGTFVGSAISAQGASIGTGKDHYMEFDRGSK